MLSGILTVVEDEVPENSCPIISRELELEDVVAYSYKFHFLYFLLILNQYLMLFLEDNPPTIFSFLVTMKKKQAHI